MEISTKGKGAVEALLYMASNKEKEVWPVKVISSELNISERYLEQIFFLLRKSGLLEAVRGAKGGYYLAKKADEIKVGEILRIVEGDLFPVPCIACEQACTCNIQDICTTRGLWHKLAEAISSVVDYLSLQELADQYVSMERKKINENLY